MEYVNHVNVMEHQVLGTKKIVDRLLSYHQTQPYTYILCNNKPYIHDWASVEHLNTVYENFKNEDKIVRPNTFPSCEISLRV
jgi:hypothetical protein